MVICNYTDLDVELGKMLQDACAWERGAQLPWISAGTEDPALSQKQPLGVPRRHSSVLPELGLSFQTPACGQHLSQQLLLPGDDPAHFAAGGGSSWIVSNWCNAMQRALPIKAAMQCTVA